MIFRNTINIAENRVGGLESTAEQNRKNKVRNEWNPSAQSILVSIPQNFLNLLLFSLLLRTTILVNVNYILPPENSQKTKLSAQERV